jgi:hypothetical protein
MIVEVQLHCFLTLALEGGEWLTSGPCCLLRYPMGEQQSNLLCAADIVPVAIFRTAQCRPVAELGQVTSDK